ncbi:MAG TPA: zinc ribbon domain-containing protein [Acidobacteriota bacterium]|nr:zinc ribbon domain-containing protein [Acidobacteriota bacterium]
MIRFTSNHSDLSNSNGFQFKFYCDKCHNGHLTRFQNSMGGTAEGLLRAAGSLFGGVFHQAANSVDYLQNTFRGTEHDRAFEIAVQEAQQYFHQCQRCGKWVCPEVCWNPQYGICKDCAPAFEEERAAARAQGAQSQLFRQGRWGVVLATPDDVQNAIPATCSHCNAPTTGTRFCSECGQPLQQRRTCPGCNHQLERASKYCPECGTRIPGWNA